MLRILFIDTFVSPVWQRRWLWVLYIAFWVISWLFLDRIESLQTLFFLFALIVFTVPHGVSDVYIPAWILNPPWEKRFSYWGLIFCLFAILALVVIGVFSISVHFVVALYAGLIMWHWGSLDTLRLYPHRGPAWIIGSIGRGMLVTIAPLYFKPLETQEIILSLLNTEHSHILSVLYSYSNYFFYLALSLEIAGFLANKFIEGRGLPRQMAAHAVESLFLIATFAWLSPITSMTFYFMIIHPIRHMFRVEAYIPEGRGNLTDNGGMLKNLPNLFQRTNLATFLAGFLLSIWFAWQMYSGNSMKEAAFGSLLPIILLMIPHSIVSLLADFNPKRLED